MNPPHSSSRSVDQTARRPLGEALIELAARPPQQPGAGTADSGRALGPALLANAMTASDPGSALDSLLASVINTPNTNIYDKAIDSVYLTAGTGGSRLHHLIDGQHDLLGAFSAAQAASPTDSLSSEIFGTAHHLTKDLFSKMGLPVVSLEPDAYRRSADWIQDHLGLSKHWQADLLQINATELLGGSLSAAAVVLGANRKDVGALAETAVSSGLAGALAANPIAMCAGSVALALACRHCSDPAQQQEAMKRASAAGAGTVTTMAVGKLLGGVAAAGTFPLIGSLALSLTAGILVRNLVLRRWQRPAVTATPSTSDVPVPPAQLWQRQVTFQALQVRDHLDAAALEVLRQAFPANRAADSIDLFPR